MSFTLSIARLSRPNLTIFAPALARNMRCTSCWSGCACRCSPPSGADAVANMHCHTFFSFNAYGHSPTSLAWLGRQTVMR